MCRYSDFQFCIFLTVALMLILSSNALAQKIDSGNFFEIPIASKYDLEEIAKTGVEIRHRTWTSVVVFAHEDSIDYLAALGFVPRQLQQDPALPSRNIEADYFHKNSEVGAILDDLAANYPDLSRRIAIGTSVEGRSLHGIVISKDVYTASAEPEIRLIGNIHGNELMGVEVPLNFAQYLLETYATDSDVRDLVDSTEITIIPCLNPDGRERQTRHNANDIDLNRNFGYQYKAGVSEGDREGGSAFSEPEAKALADFHLAHNPVLAFSYHTYGDIVNWLWNYTPFPSPDELQIRDMSDRYADIADYSSINGYDWYQTYGDTNDFAYGSRGTIEWTIEIDNDDVSYVWSINRQALMDILPYVHSGLHGLVTDIDTGIPLNAMILCEPNSWPVYTDPEVGDFHRLLPGGTYGAFVWAPGYEGKYLANLEIPEGGRRDVDVSLVPNDRYFAFQAVATSTFYSNMSYSPSALGPPDGNSFSITKRGSVVFDMALSMQDQSGDDIKVFEGEPYEGERYEVFVGKDYTGPWVSLGVSSGSQTFDFSDANIDAVRYLRIDDMGDVIPNGASGFDLDAVEYRSIPGRDFSDPDSADGDSDGDIIDGDEDMDTERDDDQFDSVDEDIESVDDADSDAIDGDDDTDALEQADSLEDDSDQSETDPEIYDTDGDDTPLPDGDITDGDVPVESDGDTTIVTETSDGGCKQSAASSWPLLIGLLFLIILRRKRFSY